MGIVEGIIGLVGAATSIVGGIMGASAASKGAAGSANIMRQKAAMDLTSTGVGLQRKSTAYTQQLGVATAHAGASGFQKTGTLSNYLTQFAQAMKSNLNWDTYAAGKTYGLQMQAADVTESSGQQLAITSALQGGAGAMQGISRAGGSGGFNWWGKT